MLVWVKRIDQQLCPAQMRPILSGFISFIANPSFETRHANNPDNNVHVVMIVRTHHLHRLYY